MSAFHQECGQPFVEKYIDPSYAYYAPFPGELDEIGLFPLQEASTSAADNTAPDYYEASNVSGQVLLPTGNQDDLPPWPFKDAFEQGSHSGAQPSPTVLARDTQLLPTEQQCHACQTHLVGGQLYCDPLNYGAVETAISARGAVHQYEELMTEPNVPVHTYMPYAINSAHLPGSNEAGTAYRPYQTDQGPAHIVDEEAYQSTSNYEVNNRDHDGGNTWNTTCISSAGTAALAQSDPSPRRHPARQTTVRSRPPRRRVRPDRLLSPINMIANAGTQCNYLSPEGVLCGVTQSTGGSLAKHWLLHAMREIVRIEGGEMEMSHATIINTEARMLVASRFRTPCPHSRCRKRASYYRPEGLADHLTTCSAGPGIPPPSYEVAKQVAHELMAELVRYDQEVFRSMYEGAVWRILHAI